MKSNQMKWAGNTACIWSLLYIPIHIYWAFGGMILMPGVLKDREMWAWINWGASIMLLVAAILAFLLVHPLGQKIPSWLMVTMGWFACVLPLSHAMYGYVTKVLFLAGVISLDFFEFSPWATIDFDYWILLDMLLFEVWFLIAGILFGLATLYYQSEIRDVMDKVLISKNLKDIEGISNEDA